MPLNYKVSGESTISAPVLTPRAVNANMFDAAIQASQLAKAQKAKAEEDRKVKEANQMAENAKFNVDGVNNLNYQNSLNKAVKDVIKYSAENPSDQIGILQRQSEVKSNKNKANAAIAESTRAYQQVDQLPSYYNKSVLNTRILEASNPKKEESDEIDWNRLNTDDIQGVVRNPYDAINPVDMFQVKTDKMPELIRQNSSFFTNRDPNDGTADGQLFKVVGNKMKFEVPIYQEGTDKVIGWEPGVNDAHADVFLKDSEVRGYTESQWDKYLNDQVMLKTENGDTRDQKLIKLSLEQDLAKENITSEGFQRKIVKDYLTMFNKVTPIDEISQKTTFSKPTGNKDDEFKAVKVTNQKRNINIGTESKPSIVTGEVPEEYRFSGTKTKSPIAVNSTRIYDENTNQKIEGLESVGDKTFNPTRVFLMAYDPKQNKYIHNTVDRIKTNPDLIWKWMAGGTMAAKGVDKKGKEINIKRNVFIPIEEVSNDIKATYGFDLEDRDVDEISDLELTSIIKQNYPKLSKEEKLQMFKKIRGQ